MFNFYLTLQNRNFRLFFLGQGFANIGNLIKQVAIGWLVYQITDSEIMLAIVMFSRELAAFLVSPFAGVVTDRFNKYRLLLLTNFLLMLNALALGLLSIFGYIDVVSMVVIQLLFGSISGLEIPTRQAFINDLVENKENLTNAIALNSTLFNSARIVGPAIAGILIPIIGEGFCFLIYAGMLALIIVVFGFIRYHPPKVRPRTRNFAGELQEGVQYALASPSIRTLLLLFTSLTMFGMSYEMLLPVFAEEVFRAGATGLGYMTSAIGAGSIVGAIYLANKKDLLGLEKILIMGVITFSVFIASFSFLKSFTLAMVFLFVAGTGRVLVFTANNTLLQSLADDDKRGRVLSLYIMIFMGSKTLGYLIMGFLAKHLNAPTAVLIGSIGCLVGLAFLYPRVTRLRQDIDTIQTKNLPSFKHAED